MIPYYLLTRDRRVYDRMARDLNHLSRVNTHLHDRDLANRSANGLSEMISAGTLHAVNAVERGWNRMASIIRR